MRKIVCHLLLVCMVSSPHIYARSKIKVHEVEIVPSLSSYDDSEYYKLNEVEIVPPLPYKDQMDCCSRRNKKNNTENEQAKIAISTIVLLGIATLGMIFVARDSH